LRPLRLRFLTLTQEILDRKGREGIRKERKEKHQNVIS